MIFYGNDSLKKGTEKNRKKEKLYVEKFGELKCEKETDKLGLSDRGGYKRP